MRSKTVQPWWMACAMALVLFVHTRGAFAQGLDLSAALGEKPKEPVAVKAYVSDEPLVPGKSAKIVVELTIDKRYHVQSAFARKPYDTVAATLTPKPANGISYGEVEYQKGTEIPTPQSLGKGGTVSLYEGTAYILVPVTVTADAAAGERQIELSLRTQACDDKQCLLPKTISIKVPVRVGKAGEASVPANEAVFKAAEAKEFASKPSAETQTGAETQPATATATTPAAGGSAATGPSVALLSNDQQLALIAARPYKPVNADEQQHSLGGIFLLALVGGIILNVMPCVLPVIPLKALSFVQQAHGEPRVALLHALAFSAGIVGLFVALAVVLRVFGLFYGQQFQSPAFLITMVMFVVALALSMLGVWTINPPQAVYNLDARISDASRQSLPYAGPSTPNHGAFRPLLGSFGSGVMATLLATPCSAPFLGPVFAWALAHPAWLTALVLAVVGIGMSLPYLFLAAFPKLLNRVPRAGRWSELLKQGLGIVMLGVAIYLVTLVPDTQLWPWVLVGAIVVALVCWAWGQIPSPVMEVGKIWAIRSIAVTLGLALGLGIYWLAASTTRTRPTMEATGTVALGPTQGQWLPFNVALLDEALKQGRPVVVDWTADWCINCRVLEATVLNRQETIRAFADSNALLLRADLTEENPPASELNRKLGGEAIPVLAIFAPSRPYEPVVLRDSYGKERVIKELNAAKK